MTDPVIPRGKPSFDQDPHRMREVAERNLEAAIGREVRNFRRQQNMTVAELAGITGLSIGMLHAPKFAEALGVFDIGHGRIAEMLDLEAPQQPQQ